MDCRPSGSGEETERRELRVALVLNGGVSLAIWMGGVTHELNLVRLASRNAQVDDTPAEGAVVDVWKKILSLAKRRVEVDIIAGTSAGGLNGAILATAIAHGTNPPYMGEQWARLADLKTLAQPPEDGVRSLLNGTYFQGEVTRLLTDVARSPRSDNLEGDCTLLMTATAVGARPRVRRLEGDQSTCVVDSRRVYRFEHWRPDTQVDTGERDDGGRVAEAPVNRDDFADVATLARAARASASFPIAFDQVWESEQLYRRRTPLYLADRPADQCSWLMDGGVLDNAPFEPLLTALLDRPVSTPFDRTLVYVTPSVGRQVMSSGLSGSQPPDVGVVFSAILAAVREPDQRLDDEALKSAYRLMGYAVSQPHTAIQEYLAGNNPDPACYVTAAENLFEFYQRGRNEALERQLAESGNPNGQVWRCPDRATMPPLRPGIPEKFPLPDGQWTYGLPAADRILRWWGRALVAIADDGALAAQPRFASTMRTLGRAQRRVTELKAEYVRRPQAMGQEVLTEAAQIDALRGFYEQNDALLRGTVYEAAHQVAACFPRLSAAELLSFSVAVEIVSSVHSWGGDEYDVPRFRYVNLTPAASPIVEDFTILARNEHWPLNKLQGERLQHFGAFVSEAGRRYDWTWGRLDGASALFNQLLGEQPGSVDSCVTEQRENLRRELAEAILAAEQPTAAVLRQQLAGAVAATEDRTATVLRVKTEQVLKSGPYDILTEMSDRNETFRVLRRNAQDLVRGSRMSVAIKFAINRLIGTVAWIATRMLAVSIAKARLTRGATQVGGRVREAVRAGMDRVRAVVSWPGRIFRRNRG